MTFKMNEETPPTARQYRIPASLLAGLSGGVVSTILLYPLDLVKVRLQVNEEPPQPSLRCDGRSSKTQSWSNRFVTLRTIRGVIRHEGVMGIYQGLAPGVLGSAVSWGGYFFLYDGIKGEWLRFKQEQQAIISLNDREERRQQAQEEHSVVKLGSIENFTVACISGAIMVVCTNPLWLIKTRMQLQMKQTALSEAQANHIKPPYLSIAGAARTIICEEGFLGLYKGAVPALMLVSHGGVQFTAYEFLKERFHLAVENRQNSSETYSPVSERFRKSFGYLTIGAISKIIATTITYPIQVIKSRLQQRSQSIELTACGNARVVHREYRGVIDVVTRVRQMEGPFGFFKGCVPNAIRVAPGSAITFFVYETVMDALS